MNVNPVRTARLYQIGTHSAVSPQLQKDSPAAQKLRKTASEFESLLLANWWSTMKQSAPGGGEEGTDPGKDTLDQLGIQAMSAAVANGGGLGIGSMLVHSLLSKIQAPAPTVGKSAAGSEPAGSRSASEA